MTLIVSLWISHGGWQSHSKYKCHTPSRRNTEYSTHGHFCFASLRFHIFFHTITGDRIFCFWSVIRIIEHVCTYIYFIIDMMGGHRFQLYLPPEGTAPLTMGYLCGQSAWSSFNQFLHQRPQSQKKKKFRAWMFPSRGHWQSFLHWAWNRENNLCSDHFPHSSLMSRIV